MTLSILHQRLIEENKGKDVVDILGPNYETVLNFCIMLRLFQKKNLEPLKRLM